MSEIKKVKIGSTTYEINAKYIQDGSGNAKTWADITQLINEKGSIVVLQTLPTANAESYALYKTSLVFVPDASAVSGTYIEYVILRSGTEGSYTYSWEAVGTTKIDLANYLQKGVVYTAGAKANGAHTHTVTIPTISVDGTNRLGATASGTAVGADGTETFVKSYPGSKKKMVKSTASKATAGTAKSFNTDAIKSASLTGTTTFAVAPTVDSNGVLEFTTAQVGISTSPASKDNITPYTFTDVAVATGAVDDDGTGAEVLVGLGTASTGSALTGVKVTTQPTITITESTTNTGPVNEHTTTSTATATTSSDGTHTHDLEVATS